MAGSEKNRGAERVQSATSRHYTRIPARLPDTRTRPAGLVNLKARMECGGLAGVCQEETAGTSQSGRGEKSEGKKMRQTKAGRIQRRQQFLLPLPPRFLWCNLTPSRSPDVRTHTHTEPVPDLSYSDGCLSPFFSLSLSLFFGII